LKVKAIILFILVAALTTGAVFGLNVLEEYLFEKSILEDFEDLALEVTDLQISDTRIRIRVRSVSDTLCPEDLQLVRYINSVIPTVETDKSVHISVCTKSGDVIYQKLFTDTPNIRQPQAAIPANYMDSTLLKAELTYAFNQKGINCTAYKETSGSQCYIRGEEPMTETGRILNFTVVVPSGEDESSDPELLAVYFDALISMLNTKGAGISQYNLYVTDAEGVCLYLASVDLLTNDTVRLV